MERIMKAWEDITEVIKNEVTDVSFRTWFEPLQLVRIDDRESTLYVANNNHFAAAVIKNKYWDVLNGSVQRVLGLGYRVEILDVEEKDNAEANNSKHLYGSEGTVREHLAAIAENLSGINDKLGVIVGEIENLEEKSQVGSSLSDIVVKLEDFLDSHAL